MKQNIQIADPLEKLLGFFDQIELSPQNWPVKVSAALAGASALQKWPEFPKSATIHENRLGHGAGLNMTDARRRACGELIEIASCCSWGDELQVSASVDQVGNLGWMPEQVTGFSRDQYDNRTSWNTRLLQIDWVPPLLPKEKNISWMNARCLHTDREIMVPSDAVLIGLKDRGDEDAVAVADTNGCAAGQTHKAALSRAVFELLERDALARWWYGKVPANGLPISAFSMASAASEAVERRQRTVRFFRLASDFSSPTVAAVAADPDGRRIGLGTATRQSIEEAVNAAALELMMIELKFDFALAHPGRDPALSQWIEEANLEEFLEALSSVFVPETSRGNEVDDRMEFVLEDLQANGCRIAAFDMTRCLLGVPVVRAVSPDLCHWKPRFGRKRVTNSTQACHLEDAGHLDQRTQLLMI